MSALAHSKNNVVGQLRDRARIDAKSVERFARAARRFSRKSRAIDCSFSLFIARSSFSGKSRIWRSAPVDSRPLALNLSQSLSRPEFTFQGYCDELSTAA